MASEDVLLDLFWVGFFSAVIYLVSLTTVVELLQRNYTDYWQRIGSPRLFNRDSFFTIFPKIIFGRDLPSEAIPRYRLLLWAVRVSLFASTAIWLFLMVMMILGKTPKQ